MFYALGKIQYNPRIPVLEKNKADSEQHRHLGLKNEAADTGSLKHSPQQHQMPLKYICTLAMMAVS